MCKQSVLWFNSLYIKEDNWKTLILWKLLFLVSQGDGVERQVLDKETQDYIQNHREDVKEAEVNMKLLAPVACNNMLWRWCQLTVQW